MCWQKRSFSLVLILAVSLTCVLAQLGHKPAVVNKPPSPPASSTPGQALVSTTKNTNVSMITLATNLTKSGSVGANQTLYGGNVSSPHHHKHHHQHHHGHNQNPHNYHQYHFNKTNLKISHCDKSIKNIGHIHNVNIKDCYGQSCTFVRGNKYFIRVNFTMTNRCIKLGLNISGLISKRAVPFPVDDKELCKDCIKNLEQPGKCLLKKGHWYIFEYSMDVLKSFPPIAVPVSFQLKCQEDKSVFCFTFPVRLS